MRPRVLYLLFAVLAIGVLTPYLTTGYYYDDTVNSMLPVYLKLKGLTLGSVIAQMNHTWIFERGRLFPVAIAATMTAWNLLQNILTYRVVQLGFVLSNLWLFMAVIRALGGGRRLALLCALTVLTLFQLRNYHDPIASYVFLQQIGLALGLGTVLLFSRFLKTGKGAALWASLLLQVCSLLLYETQLTFVPILLYLAFQPRKPGEHAFAARWGHFGLTLLYLGTVAWLRLTAPLPYYGMQTRLGLKTIWTLACQFLGGFPVIYAIFGRSSFYSAETLVSSEFLSLGALAVLLGGAGLFFFTHQLNERSDEKPGLESQRGLRVLGWTLALIPALFVAISEKYQGEVNRPGVAYLPVYLSYFGVAILLGLAFARSRKPKLMAAIYGLLLAFSFSTNWIAADRLNSYWNRPRVLIESAFQ